MPDLPIPLQEAVPLLLFCCRELQPGRGLCGHHRRMLCDMTGILPGFADLYEKDVRKTSRIVLKIVDTSPFQNLSDPKFKYGK